MISNLFLIIFLIVSVGAAVETRKLDETTTVPATPDGGSKCTPCEKPVVKILSSAASGGVPLHHRTAGELVSRRREFQRCRPPELRRRLADSRWIVG
ncbi:uncharacterized protein G2W53_035506 [Senna tora]|uniref:Uncharacterized protein n=1 Tax=Senna tora TaxID=362788 RepID=A0A834SQD0_9FABA|nr:uncharacterized protein G2W53_035506 [Senna tora]